MVKKRVKESFKYLPMVKMTNHYQIEFNGKVREDQEVISDKLDRIFDGKLPEDLVKMVERGKKRVELRCK